MAPAEIGLAGISKGYQRYSGFWQTSPLTAEEKRYDNTCREIDEMQSAICKKSMGLFTAGEFLWLSHYVNKVRFGQTQKQLEEQLSALQSLFADLSAREK